MASRDLSYPSSDIESFRDHLNKSDRILALLGAGLSASSGLPTFRGAGGIWRNKEATSLATPQAFQRNPGLVWQFYSYRRHMALHAQPNKAHFALAELAKNKPNFVTLSQNVDGLSQRAGHPAEKLHLLHGNIFDVKCSGFYCDYFEKNNQTDPIVPALAIPTEGPQPEPSKSGDSGEATQNLMNAYQYSKEARKELDISNVRVPIPQLEPQDLPQCPKCKTDLLRPGIVWFGESLPKDVLHAVDTFIYRGDKTDKIDLMLVIGTSAQVHPAASYIEEARDKGARVCVINIDEEGGLDLTQDDWFFVGDAAQILPEIFKSIIGEI